MGSISLRQVEKTYGAGARSFKAIHGVDAEIADGEFIVIVGPSGCGKSTLLRMVAGLEEISGGEIDIGGRVVNRLEPAERDIAMVFQNYALYPHMTVFDNMAYGLKIAKVPKDEIQRRVEKAAGILELGTLLQRRPRELSGGQRQRVAMGRAIVRQPAVFLFDEPLSNLDAKLRAQTRLEIQKLHRELGVTSLFVTHDQVEAMTLGQRLIVMNGGRIEQIGTPEDVYGRPASTFVAGFIGSPPMNLIAGQAEGGRFAVGGAGLPLPAAAPRDGALTLGVRPEHATLGAGGWQLKVEMLEMLGAERLVYGRLGEAAFTLRIDGTLTPPAIGSEIGIVVAPQHLHWYDPATGRRVE
ncbi:sn-glycerol-3-phosphate ABC transporter ATP-binding protein UgpC [Rubrivivax gelatinosus]|uniref:sn-glycerol-3-phosphate import ATP-binding protein UgpC n=1 Tax=Rubrivivax gelatinosus TaxID=28068 RepID=UPI0019073FC8|nr:sn-glycerol-3-phosphate import ATP-binding protein UgpC [Rubrivivax gelatinosus]MBK1615200.1 sn-glycerol-3-phosphate ABC transporter ATP-binding protein UgpC [Rubrivivax gelatinosus]